MSYLTHINRHDDLNFNEDFEEAIARNIKEEDFENDSESEGNFFKNHLFGLTCVFYYFHLIFSVF